jgi:hypothetical protein
MSVSSPVESHGYCVVSVNIVSNGFEPRACYCYVCLSALDVFDVIVLGDMRSRRGCPDAVSVRISGR